MRTRRKLPALETQSLRKSRRETMGSPRPASQSRISI
jgi:hypothetical protein